MLMKMRWLRLLSRLAAGMLLAYTLVYLAQMPFRSLPPQPQFDLLAHRGVHQTFHRRDLRNDTCTAERIDNPRHAYLENTLPSMQAAFDAGATRIEFDVHATADGELVVWHDWTVDCRTEGQGETRTLTLAQLQALDAGYGYTADGGKSYPFRGQGIGLIPSLREVLQAFPEGQFVIDQKDRSPATTQLIARVLDSVGASGRVCLGATAELNALYLDMPAATVPRCTLAEPRQIKRCLIDYLGSGWTGVLPASCVGQSLTVPDGALVRLLWGWPGTFIERVRASGGKVYVWTDDPARLAPLRALGIDGILTDRIELMSEAKRPES
ncbi:MAG TPA: glycerophosphodiester phosphodiesterase family protein [Xanthomonadales bacterium]|nr:glycerophosphodiester phosphodiesterase family protein [Xanthomonadales bacterium]